MPDLQKLLNAIDAADENSYGSDGDGEMSAVRETYINLYNGANLWPVPEGRSQVTDRSVFETVQWILPSLCRIFASGEDIVELPPVGPEDEAGAKQESQYLNWLITQKNDWFNIFLDWAQDALMLPNGYVMACRESRQRNEIERYERQTQEGLALLLQDGDAKIVQSKSYPDPDYKPQAVPDPVTGMPVVQPPPMLFDVMIRRTSTEKAIRIYVLPPERCKVSHRTPSWKLTEADYFEWWEETTISSLRQRGFDVDDDVAMGDEMDTAEDDARNRYGEAQDEENSNDPSMRLVKARFVWIRHDYDEDGIAEMQYCVVIGKTIVFREECSRIPVASAVTSNQAHRHPGTPISEIVADLQAIKTTLLRQGLDNLYLANNPQKVVVDGQVNLDDALISRPGGLIRVNSIEAIRHETPPFVFPQVMEGMEYMDQIRENRTGTNRYFTGIDQNALNKTATGIQQLSTMAAQRVEQIARIFGSAVADLCSIVHELVLRGGHKKETIKLRNEWVEVDPASWRHRTDFKLSVGFAAGNKDVLVNRLMMIGDMQAKAMQAGLSIVTEQNLYETAVELTKASDFSSPQRFWTDPAGAQPKPPQPDPILEAEKIKAQTTLAKTEADNAKDLRINAEKLMLEKYKVDTHAEIQLRVKGAELDHSESTLEKQARIDREMEGQRANSSLQMEQFRVSNDPKVMEATAAVDTAAGIDEIAQQIAEADERQTQTILQAFEQVMKAVTAPRELVRDGKGRPVGSRVVTEAAQ